MRRSCLPTAPNARAFSRKPWIALSLVLGGALLAACVGDDPIRADDAGAPPATADAAPADAGVVVDAAPTDAGVAVDATPPLDATVAPFRVFVSSMTYDGAPGMGGRAAMDSQCTGLGGSLLGPRRWLAYVADPGAETHPADRFQDVPGGWFLANETALVVASKALLRTGAILRPITMTETKAQLPMTAQDFVWTGMNGNIASGQHCGRWQNGTFNLQGRVGLAQRGNAEWQSAGEDTCNQKRRIYCFEQP